MSRRPRRARTTRSCSICTKARTRSTGRGALDSPPDEIESRHVVSSRVDAVSILGRFAAASLPSKALRAPAACRAGVVTMRSCRAGLGHSLPRTRKRCTDQQLEIRPVDPRECLLDIARSLGFPLELLIRTALACSRQGVTLHALQQRTMTRCLRRGRPREREAPRSHVLRGAESLEPASNRRAQARVSQKPAGRRCSRLRSFEVLRARPRLVDRFIGDTPYQIERARALETAAGRGWLSERRIRVALACSRHGVT